MATQKLGSLAESRNASELSARLFVSIQATPHSLQVVVQSRSQQWVAPWGEAGPGENHYLTIYVDKLAD